MAQVRAGDEAAVRAALREEAVAALSDAVVRERAARHESSRLDFFLGAVLAGLTAGTASGLTMRRFRSRSGRRRR